MRSNTESTARSSLAFDMIANDSLRPAALIVVATFLGFGIQNFFAYPSPAREIMVAWDLVLVAAGLLVYRISRRTLVSISNVRAIGAALSTAVLAAVLTGASLGVSPQFSFYVAVLIIASAGSMLSTPWAVGVGAVNVIGWAIVALSVLSRAQLAIDVGVIASAVAVGGVVHIGRVRAYTRISALLRDDERRAADLDRIVAERTQALRDELARRDRLESQLRHAQKLDAIGRLAGGVAHDFNNLLTVIRMSLEIVRTEPENAAEAIRDADDATDRAAGLTKDLLAFARKQSLARKHVAVTDIVTGAMRMVRRLMEASVTVDVRVADDAGDVIADSRQVEQVLINLAINAADAMQSRGTLTIDVSRVELANDEMQGLPAGTYARLAVSDTGSGMDDDTLRAIFEPFFTTKAVGRGTGLGLAVAHGIVTQHGGEIAVTSTLGKGSTFAVYLPGAVGESLRRSATHDNVQLGANNELILLVEDEPVVRRAIQRNLELLGYRVMAAEHAEAALEIAAKTERFDLLLTDVVMPGMDGAALARKLRERWPEIPVLFLTGYSRDRLTGDAVGPRDVVIEKPYRPRDLARTIREMLS